MSTNISQNAAQSLNVNGILASSVLDLDDKANMNDDAWEARKKEALAAWAEGNTSGWKFARAAGNAASCNKDMRPLEWALKQRSSSDPMIAAGARRTCSIIEGLFFGSQLDSGKMDFTVPAAAPALDKRTAEDFAAKAAKAQWDAMKGTIRSAWNGAYKCKRETTHRTDTERLNEAARVIARLLENPKSKITMKEVNAAIDAARATLKAKAATK